MISDVIDRATLAGAVEIESARARQLTVALTEALTLVEDLAVYVPDSLRRRWKLTDEIQGLREVRDRHVRLAADREWAP